MKIQLLIVGIGLFLSANSVIAADMAEMPDWNDEDTAYRDPSRGLILSPGFFEDIEGGNYSEAQLGKFVEGCCFTNNSLHEDTEGDDLWTAYHMWKRLEGIKPGASARWRDRVQTYKDFYINDYRGVLTGAGRETDNSYDHLYGWGLCDWYKTEGVKEPDGGAAALATINGLVSDMVARNNREPGDSILHAGNGGRKWARQLRFAVAAADVSPTPQNISWRDKVIDIVLQTPDFYSNYQMYFLSSDMTTKRGFDGAAGERVAITFHMGIFMDAMWHAWLALDKEGDPKAMTMRQRLLGMAAFYRDYGPNADGYLPEYVGVNINTGERVAPATGNRTYTQSPINGLVFAYKLTGDKTFLDSAWALWLMRQQAISEKLGLGSQDNKIVHYVDSQLASSYDYRLLANNKGELQYVYALFENGGYPTLIEAGQASPAAPSGLQVE